MQNYSFLIYTQKSIPNVNIVFPLHEGENIIGANTCIEIPNTHFSGKNMWIVKAINLNRGMCMKIVNSYEQMVKVINKFKEGVDYNFTKEKIANKRKTLS